MKLNELRENPNNPSTCTEKELERLAGKLKRVPLGLTAMRIAYVTDDADGGKMVISGNKRLRVLKQAYGEDAELPDEYFQDVTAMSEAERHEFIVSANISDGEWDLDRLLEQYGQDELKDLMGEDELAQLVNDYKEELFNEKYEADQQTCLADRYVVTPFSVLISYKGSWVERKRQWRNIIFDNGKSRENKLSNDGIRPSCESLVKPGSLNNGVSIFDPVLSEAMVRWFCPEGGSVFDCFAGDTMKGLVFSILGHKFIGIELREEQVKANYENIDRVQKLLGDKTKLDISYACDDGQNVLKHVPEKSQDFLFSCPPYYDLEVYSDLENDASNQSSYADFIKILENAFTDAVKCLKDDRFAVVVVGDVRDKNGGYYCFPDDIKRIFRNAGMLLYNELIYVETVGTAGLRVNNHMSYRKVTKVHQNVLVFYKGDTSKIKENFQPIDYSEDEINTMLEEHGGVEQDRQ